MADLAQVVVITGGSAGIGRAAAKAFAAKGYAVGLIARGAERLEQARLELVGMGVPVHVVMADVADADAVEQAADAIEAALGPITVWVNNAMATVYSPIKDLDAAEFRRVTDVTYLGSVHGTMSAMRRMKRGTIVQVSSVLAWRALPIQGAYCGAKFALRGFTEALRSELIHDGSPLHLTMVHLPAVNTPQFTWARNKTGQRTQAPSPYQPEVAADAIVFAATHKRRDVYVGASTPPTILAARLAPSVVDRAMAKKAYSAQLSDTPAAANEGNLFTPAPGGHQGAHGDFDAGAKTARDIYTSRQADVVAAGLLLVGAIGLRMLATSPLFIARGLAARAVVRRLP
ncbi:MAG: SDR family oxidoreductase [Gemmatimonadaceae bacterium]|nr:SDR family oxidoreductase [Acetobacteraceae bacterium]